MSAKPGSKLYGDPRVDHAREAARVAANHRGEVNAHEIAAAQLAAVKRFEALLRENPGLPLDQFKEIVAAADRPALPGAAVAARVAEVVAAQRKPIFGTTRDGQAVLVAEKRANQGKPILNALLNSTGAGNSVPLARLRLNARAEDLTAHSPTAGKRGSLR